MVPKTTLVYLKSDAGQEVIRRIKMMDKISKDGGRRSGKEKQNRKRKVVLVNKKEGSFRALFFIIYSDYFNPSSSLCSVMPSMQACMTNILVKAEHLKAFLDDVNDCIRQPNLFILEFFFGPLTSMPVMPSRTHEKGVCMDDAGQIHLTVKRLFSMSSSE